MAFKLQQLISILSLAFAISSCSTSKDFKDLFPGMNKKDFEKSYQVAFICGCIDAGTNGNLSEMLKENNDLGLYSEAAFLSQAIVKEADSLGRAYARKVQPINYEDAGNRKPYFSSCIYFSLNKEVRAIIEKQYKELKKGKLTYTYED